MPIKEGNYIVSSSTGLVIKGVFRKMNAIFYLSKTDFKNTEIKTHIDNGFLRFMGPKQSQATPEIIQSSPITSVSLAPQSLQEDTRHPPKKKSKKKRSAGVLHRMDKTNSNTLRKGERNDRNKDPET